jgi:thymidine kinase
MHQQRSNSIARTNPRAGLARNKKPSINFSMSDLQFSKGLIEVIYGCMFSGKSEELMRRLKRSQIAKQEILLFKPCLDNRYSQTQVCSHDQNKMAAIIIKEPNEIFSHFFNKPNTSVIGIDEAQFFNNDLIAVCTSLADRGLRVIVAGLDQTYDCQPFSPIPELIAEAEINLKLYAVCVDCGSAAHRSFRVNDSEKKILIGEKKDYIPLCRHCYNKHQSTK